MNPETNQKINNVKTLNQYQEMAGTTAIYRQNKDVGTFYPFFGLAEEAGEVLGKIKRVIRDDGGEVTDDRRNQILMEVGDVLWYASAICGDFNATLEEVAQMNLQKLFRRREQNTIQGQGDDR